MQGSVGPSSVSRRAASPQPSGVSESFCWQTCVFVWVALLKAEVIVIVRIFVYL